MTTVTRHPTPTTPTDLPTSHHVGIDLAWLGEDSEWAIAHGHVDPALFTAAAFEFARAVGVHFAVDPRRVRHVWAVREVDGSLPEGDERRECVRWEGVPADAVHAWPATVLAAETFTGVNESINDPEEHHVTETPTAPIVPILGQPDGDGVWSMPSTIRAAVGAASVCWSDMADKGVFQEDVANQIADELMANVEAYADQKVAAHRAALGEIRGAVHEARMILAAHDADAGISDKASR